MGSGAMRRHSVFLIAVLAMFTICRQPTLTGWDDAFYVAQLTSALGDKDLVLQDDLQAFPNPPQVRLQTLRTILDDGALFNTFSIGPAVVNGAYLWPLFAAGLTTTPWVRAGLGLGALFALACLLLALRSLLLRCGYSDSVAVLAAGLAVATGPVALYGTRVTTLSHLLSALFAALLVLGLLRFVAAPGWCARCSSASLPGCS